MPYTLKLYLVSKEVLESPFIQPNDPNAKFGYEEPEIYAHINKYGKSMVRKKLGIIGYDCVYYKKEI